MGVPPNFLMPYLNNHWVDFDEIGKNDP